MGLVLRQLGLAGLLVDEAVVVDDIRAGQPAPDLQGLARVCAHVSVTQACWGWELWLWHPVCLSGRRRALSACAAVCSLGCCEEMSHMAAAASRTWHDPGGLLLAAARSVTARQAAGGNKAPPPSLSMVGFVATQCSSSCVSIWWQVHARLTGP